MDLRRERLGRLHDALMERSTRFPNFGHLALRTDDWLLSAALGGVLFDQIPEVRYNGHSYLRERFVRSQIAQFNERRARLRGRRNLADGEPYIPHTKSMTQWLTETEPERRGWEGEDGDSWVKLSEDVQKTLWLHYVPNWVHGGSAISRVSWHSLSLITGDGRDRPRWDGTFLDATDEIRNEFVALSRQAIAEFSPFNPAAAHLSWIAAVYSLLEIVEFPTRSGVDVVSLPGGVFYASAVALGRLAELCEDDLVMLRHRLKFGPKARSEDDVQGTVRVPPQQDWWSESPPDDKDGWYLPDDDCFLTADTLDELAAVYRGGGKSKARGHRHLKPKHENGNIFVWKRSDGRYSCCFKTKREHDSMMKRASTPT